MVSNFGEDFHDPRTLGIFLGLKRKIRGRTRWWRNGGHGVYLSPWIHQKYTVRHRSACKTPAESGQECLTRGKEYIQPLTTR